MKGVVFMLEYEICPTCGASLDIGEKCSICKPTVPPIPIPVSEKCYQAVTIKFNKKKG